MQAASLLLSPLVMTGADMLFQTLRNDKYLEETKRHNKRMAKLEEERIKWDQKFATEQRDHARRVERKKDAMQGVSEDRELLDSLIFEKSRVKDMIRGEIETHKSKNPYYMSVDIVLTSLLGYGLYRLAKSSSSSDKLEME